MAFQRGGRLAGHAALEGAAGAGEGNRHSADGFLGGGRTLGVVVAVELTEPAVDILLHGAALTGAEMENCDDGFSGRARSLGPGNAQLRFAHR